MRLSTVEFEEFMAWMGVLEDNPASCQDVLKDAIENVPLVMRLMMIYNNAAADDAENIMLIRNRDIVNVLVSLYQLEKGRIAPLKRSASRNSIRRKSAPKPRARMNNSGVKHAAPGDRMIRGKRNDK